MTLGIICWAGPDGEDERGSSRGFMRGRAEKSMVLETTLHLSSNANRSLASRGRPVSCSQLCINDISIIIIIIIISLEFVAVDFFGWAKTFR